MIICPKHLAIYLLNCMQQMMMIIPVNSNINEAKNVTKKKVARALKKKGHHHAAL